MDQVNMFTEDELTKLRDAMLETLNTAKRLAVKKKFKIVGKSLLSSVLVTGGVVVAILFPSPITLAVLGGAAALIGGSNGVVRDIKNVRKDSTRTRDGKKDLRALDSELVNRRTTRDVVNAVYKQSLPSAPPIYPSLQQYE